MPPHAMTRRRLLCAMGATLAAPAVARAQGFPSKPLRIVVPYPAGGSIDAMARLVGQELQAAKGWTVVIENKAGASGAVGTREVAKAEADGHTLVLGTNQTHATNAFLLKEPGYDPVTSFAAIAGLADLQHALVVPKASPATSVSELIALAKKEPGKLNYGSTGKGSRRISPWSCSRPRPIRTCSTSPSAARPPCHWNWSLAVSMRPSRRCPR